MSGEIAAISTLTIGLVGLLVLASWVIGLVDILRLPNWAWQRAGKSRTVYLVVVVLIPVVGLLIYVFTAQQAVATVAKSGRAASLPHEGIGAPVPSAAASRRGMGTTSPPSAFGSFGAASPPIGQGQFGASPPVGYGQFGASPPVGYGQFGGASPPVGYGQFGGASPPVGYSSFGGVSPPVGAQGGGSRTHQQPITVSQAFKPSIPEQSIVATPPKPTVPAGWKADATGRHQFRYWDGFQWTESVADAGVQSVDPV